MSQTVFLRLLQTDDKAASLAAAVKTVGSGSPNDDVFEIEPESFRQVPGSPFAYWVSERVRSQFVERQPLEAPGSNRIARREVVTNDDFRFLRLWFEVTRNRQGWPPLAKGGAFARFYSALPLVLDWRNEGAELRAFFIQNGESPSRNIRSESEYHRRGLTWSLRTQGGLSIRALPDGCVSGSKGPAVFIGGDDPVTLLALLAITNSRAFGALVELQTAFGSYEVGVIQRTPVPDLSGKPGVPLSDLARCAIELKRSLDTTNETSHVFHLPALLQSPEGTLAERVASWRSRVGEVDKQLAENQREIDDIAFRLYGIEGVDRRAIEEGVATPTPSDEETEESEDDS